MHIEQEVFQLRQRVAKLERQVAFLMEALDLAYQDEPGAVSPEIIRLVQQGRKIAAVKLYREMTGVGLKAAKTFIESLA